MSLISLVGAAKDFGIRTLFADLELHIGEGERVGLIGPNGAGKSTAMKAMFGMLGLREGRVLLVDGQGALHRSLLGDRLAQLASDNGWAGVVVVGAIRDVEVIDAIDIGVQALGVCPVKTDKQGVGDRDIPLLLREVPVAPGDWLYADRNGVLVSSEPIHS